MSVSARLQEGGKVGLRQLPQLRHLSLLPVKHQGACEQEAEDNHTLTLLEGEAMCRLAG